MKDVFCRIIDGDIPSTKVYEDEDVLAILDISQTTKGHTLVLPKKHYENFLSCPLEVIDKCMAVAKRIGEASISVLGAKGVNILTNAGEVAGQTVMHLHFHVIPRYEEENGCFQIVMKEQDTSKMDLPLLAAKIKNELAK